MTLVISQHSVKEMKTDITERKNRIVNLARDSNSDLSYEDCSTEDTAQGKYSKERNEREAYDAIKDLASDGDSDVSNEDHNAGSI